MFILEEDKKELETAEETSSEETAVEPIPGKTKVEETTPEEKVEDVKEEVKEELKNKEATVEKTKEDSSEEALIPAQGDAKVEKKGVPHTSEPIAKEFLPGNFNPFARPINPRFANRRKIETDLETRIVKVKRVIKTTKGGRRFKFSVLVVVGDKKGKLGYAIGKHIEIPEAIKKAERAAKKNMYRINIVGDQDTIPHEIIGHHGAARVMLKPAKEGKGIIAADVVRTVVELAGIRNIYSKNLGSNTAHIIVHATVKGLTQTKTKEQFENLKAKMVPRKPFSFKLEADKKNAPKKEAK